MPRVRAPHLVCGATVDPMRCRQRLPDRWLGNDSLSPAWWLIRLMYGGGGNANYYEAAAIALKSAWRGSG